MPRRDVGISVLSSCCFGVVLMSICSTRPVKVQPSCHRRMNKLRFEEFISGYKENANTRNKLLSNVR